MMASLSAPQNVILIAAVVLLLPGSVGLAEQSPEYHYIIFERDSRGDIHPLFERRVSGLLPELFPSPDTEAVSSVLVRLETADRRVIHQQVILVERSELVHDYRPSGPIRSVAVHRDRQIFVARVPRAEGGVLYLEDEASGRSQQFVIKDDIEKEVDLKSQASNIYALATAQGAIRSEPGPSSNRVDLLVIGEGYRADQESLFNSHVDQLKQQFFSIQPLTDYRSYVKVSSLFVASNEEGADHPVCPQPPPQGAPPPGTMRDTAFDGSYCSFGTYRLLEVSMTKLLAAASSFPDWDQIVVLVNDPVFGGSGASANRVSVGSRHNFSTQILQHEYGHSFAGLIDEYVVPPPRPPVSCTDVGTHLPACPANATDETIRDRIKWKHWIADTMPIPTPETAPFANLVGLFPGSFFVPELYRPELDTIMRTLGKPYGEVNSEAHALRLYQGGWASSSGGMSLIESAVPSAASLTIRGAKTFSIDSLEPAGGVQIVWRVDGQVQPGQNSPAFTFVPRAPGTYTVQVQVTDMSPMIHPSQRNHARNTKSWNVQAQALNGCTPGASALCLNNGRFRVEVNWHTPQGTGGHGQAEELTNDTGYFWFFNNANVEGIVKVLRACTVNQRYWLFLAGLTNVQVHTTVTDTQTGVYRRYDNPMDTAFQPVQDTGAFGESCLAIWQSPHSSPGLVGGPVSSPARGSSSTGLLLNNGRFRVDVDWHTSQGTSGQGQAVQLTNDTGYFWFFNSNNVEISIKVLRACSLDGRYWVFAAGLTNVGVDIRVTDTETGEEVPYHSPLNTAFQPIQDTSAFADSCDAHLAAAKALRGMPSTVPWIPAD